MKITIRKDAAEPEPVMELYLVQDGDGVNLCAHDRQGRSWEIAYIDAKGIDRYRLIQPSTGWPLDSDGRLLLNEG